MKPSEQWSMYANLLEQKAKKQDERAAKSRSDTVQLVETGLALAISAAALSASEMAVELGKRGL